MKKKNDRNFKESEALGFAKISPNPLRKYSGKKRKRREDVASQDDGIWVFFFSSSLRDILNGLFSAGLSIHRLLPPFAAIGRSG